MTQRFKHIENTIIEIFDNTIAYIELSRKSIIKYSEELNDTIIIDLDNDNYIVGVELLSIDNIPDIKNIIDSNLIKDNEYDKLEKSLEFLEEYKNKF